MSQQDKDIRTFAEDLLQRASQKNPDVKWLDQHIKYSPGAIGSSSSTLQSIRDAASDSTPMVDVLENNEVIARYRSRSRTNLICTFHVSGDRADNFQIFKPA